MKGYILEQNHPNPFVYSTNISFEIPKSTYVSLKIYNMQGIEVTELAGKKFSSGKHNIAFNQQLAAGSYFYVIHTDQFHAIRKMIILNK